MNSLSALIKYQFKSNNHGFTLIELLIAAAMGTFAVLVILSGYLFITESLADQERMINMQQSARACFEVMESDLEAAGCDPLDADIDGVNSASSDEIVFQADLNDGTDFYSPPDGKTDGISEWVKYVLVDNPSGDGKYLGRLTDPAGNDSDADVLIKYVDALNFVYYGDDDDGDGYPDELDPASATFSEDDIRSVMVTIVIRSHSKEQDYTDTKVYKNQADSPDIILPAQNDNYKRGLFFKRISMKNMGL